MSKELKAFRKICKNLNSYEFTDEYKENKKLIEKALEHKEKSEKALEIIKNKIVDMPLLFETFNYRKNGLQAYNAMRTRGYDLTQEEYDLLKEVLL